MSLEYIVQPGNRRYFFSWNEMASHYAELCALSDAEFLKRIPDALHFACFASYIKELGPDATISDEGIIHQLIHLLLEIDVATSRLQDVRAQFRELLKF